MSLAARSTLPALLLLTAACSSQQDDIPTPVVAPDATSPGGIYFGQDSAQSGTAASVIALVDSNTRMEVYTLDGSSLLSGLYTFTATSGFSAQARYFPLAGTTSATANLVGSYASQSQILVNYTRSDNVSGSYNLTYQALIYQTPSTLGTLAGTWAVQDAFGATMSVFNVDGGGGISGTTTSPQCTYSGSASIIDLRYNVYNLSLSENCMVASTSSGGTTQVSATYNGLATVLPASTALGTTKKQLVLAAASSTAGRLFRLSPAS